jgi:proline iminopeptidase
MRAGIVQPMTTRLYWDSSGRDDRLTGGARLIPIQTPAGPFHVWTKRIGNNPDARLLTVHGGPGMNHYYLEPFDSFLPAAGIEYYYYDQLGSGYSDQPDDERLWSLDRFVDELEQVRQALGLDASNFFLYGQSWGGMLAIEYALHHQQHLKGLIISNAMASIPASNEYVKVLTAELDPQILEQIKELDERGNPDDPRYQELLDEPYYAKHYLRLPDLPEPLGRSFRHINQQVITLMLGTNALFAGGQLATWDRTADLGKITVPTLVIGATHDVMDPAHQRWISQQVADGRYLHCPDGSHQAMYDDQEVYMAGLIRFVQDITARSRSSA